MTRRAAPTCKKRPSCDWEPRRARTSAERGRGEIGLADRVAHQREADAVVGRGEELCQQLSLIVVVEGVEHRDGGV
eukprot:4397796-Prymnesium_polylepis.2